MRCWAIEIELGGRAFDIPALPAAQWWPVLTSGELSGVLDFVESRPDDPLNVDDLLLSGAVSSEDLSQALTDAVEVAAGRSFHAAYVTAIVAGTQWAAVNGALAQSGFRWDKQPLGAALDALYSVIIGLFEKDARDKFLALLENESLTATGNRRIRNRHKVMNEFEAMAGPRPTTGVVATDERSGSARPRTQPRPRPPRQDGRSISPRRPRAPRAGSALQASSARPGDADAPASDTGPPPPP